VGESETSSGELVGGDSPEGGGVKPRNIRTHSSSPCLKKIKIS
jgi:hypothetical protein